MRRAKSPATEISPAVQSNAKSRLRRVAITRCPGDRTGAHRQPHIGQSKAGYPVSPDHHSEPMPVEKLLLALVHCPVDIRTRPHAGRIVTRYARAAARG